MQSITLKRPDDWHIHLRDDAYLARTVGDAARYFGRVLVMPNLVPPVTSVELAAAYRDRILKHAPDGFSPMMALYLTDETSKDTVAAAAADAIYTRVQTLPCRRDHQFRLRDQCDRGNVPHIRSDAGA